MRSFISVDIQLFSYLNSKVGLNPCYSIKLLYLYMMCLFLVFMCCHVTTKSPKKQIPLFLTPEMDTAHFIVKLPFLGFSIVIIFVKYC